MASISPAPAEPASASVADPVVSVRGASKHYGRVRAVDDVDLAIGRGELFGLIGHNGAGKSTLFKMMLGLIPATAGEILIDGEKAGGRGFRSVRRKTGYLPENVVLYDNLSGLETLEFFARLKGVPAQECRPTLKLVGLADAGDRRVREYSKGMRQRLGFAQALLGNPRILFLDEPTTGLDPEGIREVYAILRALREAGVTVVLSSHVLAEIQDRVDRLAILTAGRIRALGSVQALRERIDLPLGFDLRVAAGQLDRVRRALGELSLGAIEVRDERVSLQCRRESRMAVLQALSALPDAVLDLQIREPSLEDVFFGFSDRVGPWN